ncbi:MAG: TIGR03936 family radical SAM-associated protein, partial [Deltaproteobacteria bacterium]|nr:TIGR03936 family radical SAM-associated protein [Deltaproteobacteria bacterium]
LDELDKLADACLAQTGFDELSFLALSAGDFSALRTLFTRASGRCAAQQVALALPSLRVGSVDDSIMARIAGIRRTGATLAPEAGSQRLRDVINKGVTEEDLLMHVQKLLQHGWRQVKLYFMIGLPGERREDLEAIFDLSRKARDAAGRGGPPMQVTAAVSPFVPKAHTPFQWEAQLTLEETRERIGCLIGLFKGQKNLRLRWHEAQMSSLEGVFSRGDRRLAEVLERAYAKGAIFSSWMEGFSLEPWLEALEECGQRMEDWTGPRTPGAPLPWDHLASGLDPDFLRKERERALAGLPTPDCRYGACRQCGVCDTAARPSRLRQADGDPPIRPRLNFAERDQENHAPSRDAEGRLLLPPQRAEPPRIAPELRVRAARYMVWHSKEGRAAFFSQLELQTLLERALRRAGLPLSFSCGFHPLPLLSFGRALPVGVCSRAEWFAVTLREQIPAEELRKRLSPRLPDGMEITRVAPAALTGSVPQSRAETFRIAHTGQAREREDFLRAWREFERLESRMHTRMTKKGERSVDLRALVAKLEYGDDGAVLCTTDWSGGYLSPLALARAVTGEENPLKLAVTKLAQYFA